MDILDNELVKKYFGCDDKSCFCQIMPNGKKISLELIFKAMQQVINKGERCLMISPNGTITETTWMSDPLMGIRSNAIRLPDQFQNPSKREYLKKMLASFSAELGQQPIETLLNHFNDLTRVVLDCIDSLYKPPASEKSEKKCECLCGYCAAGRI